MYCQIHAKRIILPVSCSVAGTLGTGVATPVEVLVIEDDGLNVVVEVPGEGDMSRVVSGLTSHCGRS